MPKFPKPYFRKQTQTWMVQTRDGKQHNLGKDEEAAHARYHQIMALAGQPLSPPVSPVVDPPVAAPVAPPDLYLVELLDAFLVWGKVNSTPRTYEWRKKYLEIFAKSLPDDMLAKDVRPHHLTGFSDAKETWGPDTRSGFIRCIQRAYSFALDGGLIEKNPIKKVAKPPRGQREDVYSREEYDRLLQAFPDQNMRDVLTTLWHTGCRPPELFGVEAKDVDDRGKRWVLPKAKSKNKRKNRIVYLNDEAWEVTDRLRKLNPSGPIFRDHDGKPLNRFTIGRRFARKKKTLGKRYCMYGFRHSFAQRKILEGVDPITVGTLMGHSNLAMLANQYSHLSQQSDHLSRAVSSGGGTAKPASA